MNAVSPHWTQQSAASMSKGAANSQLAIRSTGYFVQSSMDVTLRVIVAVTNTNPEIQGKRSRSIRFALQISTTPADPHYNGCVIQMSVLFH